MTTEVTARGSLAMGTRLMPALSTLALAGCSLFELSDLGLEPCAADADCYPLAAQSEDGPFACFRCRDGTCEATTPADDRATRSVLEGEAAAGLLRGFPVSEGLRLVAAGAGESVAGYVRDPESPDAYIRAEIEHAGDCGSEPVVNPDGGDQGGATLEHALALMGRRVLGISRYVTEAEERLFVGLACQGKPFRYAHAASWLEPGLKSPTGRFEGVAIATLCPGSRCEAAMVAWLAPAGSCASDCGASPVFGHVFSVPADHDGDGPAFDVPSGTGARRLVQEAAAVPPRLASWHTSRGEGFVLAVVHGDKLELLPLDRAGVAVGSALAVDIADAKELSLVPGHVDDGRQVLLLAVRAGQGDGGRLMVTTVAVAPDGMETLGDFVTLDGEGVQPGLSAVFSPSGFFHSRGGWSIAWRQGSKTAAKLRATRLTPAPGGPLKVEGVRTHGASGQAAVFTYGGSDAPFAYASWANAEGEAEAEGERQTASSLAVLSCD